MLFVTKMSESQTYMRSNPWLYLKWGVILWGLVWSHIFLFLFPILKSSFPFYFTLYQGFFSISTINIPFDRYVFPVPIPLGIFLLKENLRLRNQVGHLCSAPFARVINAGLSSQKAIFPLLCHSGDRKLLRAYNVSRLGLIPFSRTSPVQGVRKAIN